MKIQFWGTAKVQIFCYFTPDESDRRGQALQRTVSFCVIALEGDVHLRRA